MRGSLLRNRDGNHAPVGFVELFFDLIFVFAVTQISHLLLHHLTWLGALEAAMLLAAVWWAWIDTSWITNWLDPERPLVRVMLFGLMAAGLVMSTSLPEAFGDKGLIFAIAFVSLQIGRGLFTLWAVRREAALKANFQRIVAWAVVGAVFWIAGGVAEGSARFALWGVALALECTGPVAGFWVPGLGRSTSAEWNVEGGHLAERVGLFVIICLGETLLITGATFADLRWTPPVVAAAASSLLTTIAMWWLYFSRKHDAASEEMVKAVDTGALARRAYTYAPIVLVAGIIVAAVGDELVLHDPLAEAGWAVAAVVIGGPILFLVGTATAVFAVWKRWPWARLGGAAVILASAFAVPVLTLLGLSIISTSVLVVLGLWETFGAREHSA